ncbi:hypothetical protein KDH_08280 [Dictyobacter sp. S3.2.2.5]|uniref:Polymerase beta nucleotidyltransferase domain-containing protein n=1 Tax=Dictyobacter halimunensis TaxID=3026934 RepID=A0ABQ6FIN1_9CHLR|nr:hypothetical protein KDH_08280 [Dictyobacter sp. S3.2.2.5]
MSHWDDTRKAAVRQRYEEALESFVARVKQDRYIVAAILFGSLAYDNVWEKSDIDMVLILRDDKTDDRSYTLVENGISIHANLVTRSKFKATFERSLQGTWAQSVLARSTLLFSTDETLQSYYENVRHVGSRDREMQMLTALNPVLSLLTKAEKWLVVKNDPIYSFLYMLNLITFLANVEVLWHADVPGREVIQQAITYNPAFFIPLYTDLAQQPKDAEVMRQAIQKVYGYIEEKQEVLFRPILNYLSEAGSARSSTEIDEYFQKRLGRDIPLICEWLADRDIIQKVATPLRLTEKSRVTMDEAAYYYDGGDSDDEN